MIKTKKRDLIQYFSLFFFVCFYCCQWDISHRYMLGNFLIKNLMERKIKFNFIMIEMFKNLRKGCLYFRKKKIYGESMLFLLEASLSLL